jgi:hypothetical protein
MNPYCSVVIAYIVHRHSFTNNTSQAHMTLRPTKNVPVTPMAANTYDQYIISLLDLSLQLNPSL